MRGCEDSRQTKKTTHSVYNPNNSATCLHMVSGNGTRYHIQGQNDTIGRVLALNAEDPGFEPRFNTIDLSLNMVELR